MVTCWNSSLGTGSWLEKEALGCMLLATGKIVDLFNRQNRDHLQTTETMS